MFDPDACIFKDAKKLVKYIEKRHPALVAFVRSPDMQVRGRTLHHIEADFLTVNLLEQWQDADHYLITKIDDEHSGYSSALVLLNTLLLLRGEHPTQTKVQSHE